MQFVLDPIHDFIISTDSVCSLSVKARTFLRPCSKHAGIWRPRNSSGANRRAENFLRDLASKVGFQINRVSTLPQVNEILLDMLCPNEFDPDKGDTANDEVFQKMMELDDDTLLSAPVSMRDQFLKLAKAGLLPDALADRIICYSIRKRDSYRYATS